MKDFFDHASLISADTQDRPGSLARIKESGFLAWLRSVGTVYYTNLLSPSHFPSVTVYLPSITGKNSTGATLPIYRNIEIRNMEE